MQKYPRRGIRGDRLLVTAALVVVCTTPLATASNVVTACAKKNGTMHLIGELFNRQECKQHEIRVAWDTGADLDVRVTALEQSPRSGAFVASLVATSGRWDYGNGLLGVPSADMQCHLDHPDTPVRVCSASELTLAAVRGKVPIGSYWLVDLTFEDQCRAGGGSSMPYMSNSSKRGTVLRVLANDLIINTGGQTAADCVNEHSVACCAQ